MHDAVRYVGIITTDANFIIRGWDPWLAEATGRREEQVRNRSLLELFPEIEARGLLPHLQRVLDHGMVEILAPAFHHYLIRCKAPGAQPHFDEMQQHVAIAPLEGPDGIRGLVITIEDVTARCVRERELTGQLKSEDETIRLRAARLLCADSDTGVPLLDLVADPSWQVRRIAALGISQKGEQEVLEQLRDIIVQEHTDLAKLNTALSALTGAIRDAVPLLGKLLTDQDAEVRMYAALALGNIGDARAVQAVVSLLDDSDENVRFHAIEALGRIGSNDAAMPLARMLETQDSYCTFAALEALAQIGDASVSPAIIELLGEPWLAVAAAEALGSLGDEQAAAAIARAYARGSLYTDTAVRALQQIHSRLERDQGEGELVADVVRPEITQAALSRLIDDAQFADEATLPAIAVVLGWLEFPAVERALIELIMPEPTRTLALDALVRRGRDSTEALIGVLSRDDADVRKSVALALGRIGDWRATRHLTALLADSNADVVIAAAAALGALGDDAAFDDLVGILTHGNPAIRHAGSAAINSIGHPRTQEVARQLLRSHDERARESGIRIAGYFGYAACVQDVITLLSDSSERVRRTAAEHLGFFDHDGARAALSYVASDEAPSVRAAALRAALYMDGADHSALLRRSFGDRDAHVRYQAVQGAALLQMQALVPDIRNLLAQDPSIPVRIAAAAALGRLRDLDSVPLLSRLVEHPEPDLACAAIAALGAFSAAQARRGIMAALRRDHERVQLAAIETIANAYPRAFDAELQRIATADGTRVGPLAIRILAESGSDEAIDILLELSAHGRRRGDVIAALSVADDVHVPRIARGLRHRDANVRRATVESLARMKRPVASRSLSVALSDPDPSVRFAADQALRRLDMWHGMRRA